MEEGHQSVVGHEEEVHRSGVGLCDRVHVARRLGIRCVLARIREAGDQGGRGEVARRSQEEGERGVLLHDGVRRSLVGVRGGLLCHEAHRNWGVEEAYVLRRGDGVDEVHPYQVRDGIQVRVPILAVVLEDVQGAFQVSYDEVVFHGEAAFRGEVEGIYRLAEDDVGSEAFLGGCDYPLGAQCSSCRHGRADALGNEVS